MDRVILNPTGLATKTWDKYKQQNVVTPLAADFIFEAWYKPLELDGSPTVGNLFTYLDTAPGAVKLVIGQMAGCHVQAFLDEAKQPLTPDPLDREPLSRLVIGKIAELTKPFYDKKTARRFFAERPVFRLCDSVTGRSDNSPENFSISFLSTEKLAPLRLDIDDTVKIDVMSYLPLGPILCKLDEMTLGEFLYSIFYELGWYGSPADRDAQSAELSSRVEDARAHPEHSKSWEEVKKDLGLDDDEDEVASGADS